MASKTVTSEATSSKFMRKLKNIGPGALVAAAFIGPGTVTTATLSGASFGYTLLWAMLFSTIATIVLQEMSARLGIISRKGLGEALRLIESPIAKGIAIFLVISAILVGNAAFQTGNILGGSAGLNVITGIPVNILGILIGIVAGAFLFTGSYKILEKLLVSLVIVMSVVFLLTALVIRPDFGAIVKGLFTPVFPEGSLLRVIALIGTTVVPYNLFLHASAVKERWSNPADIKEARLDSIISIGLGGVISMAIIITSAASFSQSGVVPANAGAMAIQLEPLLGSWAKWFFAIGLFSAGFSSAITAPLAGAFATSGALGWENGMKDTRFKAVWLGILVFGMIFAGLGQGSPLAVIIFAQAANGILLPIVAIFLLYTMNNKKLLGEYANGTISNLLGSIVIIITLFISYRSFSIVLTSIRNLLG
jgi:manganese transport protein